MDDLTELNRCIAKHWLGHLDAGQEAYLGHTSVCLGQLLYDAADLAESLGRARQSGATALQVPALNRRYLEFARLATREVTASNPQMLVTLGITLEQAQWFGQLSDEDIALLALQFKEPIVRFASQAFCRGAALQAAAARHHAAALLSTRASIRMR
jgi:tRNA U34 5-methylaminomethyl-2-thiouridine-forming methyltransferase MnmC